MAFTSIGYDGSVNEKQWAELIPSAGSSTYGIKDADDLKVTAVAGQPFTLSVASGTGWGHGVVDTETANTTVACPTVSSGTRWDMIALRRNWQPLAGGPTSVVAVAGTATKELPGDRKVVPGVEDDQPLALVQWSSLQTQPAAIIDLRCWAGNGGMVAVAPEAKLYLAKLGARVSIAGIDWQYGVGDNDLAGWNQLNWPLSTPITKIGAGWKALTGAHTPRIYRSGNMAHLVGGLTLEGGSVANMLTIPDALRPANANTTFVGSGVTSNGSSYELTIGNGILSIQPGYVTKDFATGVAVPVTCSWPLT